LGEAVPVGAEAGLEDEEFREGPGVLDVGAGLGVRDFGCGGAGKGGGAHDASRDRCGAGGVGRDAAFKGLERLDFGAIGGEGIGQGGDVRARGQLMSAVPMAGSGGHTGYGLEAPAALVEALEIVASGTVDEKNKRLRALGDVIESAGVGGDAEIEESVGEPDLVFCGGKETLLVAGDGGGDGVEGVEADVGVAGAIVEKRGVKDVLGRDVVFEAQKIVAGPVFPGVGAGGLLFNDGEGVLDADRIREPEAAALEGTGESEARVPVAEVDAFLDVDAGKGIGGAEAPAVVAIGSLETEDAGACVCVTGAEISRLDFGGAGGIDIEARGELAVDGIADFETVKEILRFAGTGAGDVEVVGVVLRDFGESDQAFRQDVGAVRVSRSAVSCGSIWLAGAVTWTCS
jgi:hypothetical protein